MKEEPEQIRLAREAAAKAKEDYEAAVKVANAAIARAEKARLVNARAENHLTDLLDTALLQEREHGHAH